MGGGGGGQHYWLVLSRAHRIELFPRGHIHGACGTSYLIQATVVLEDPFPSNAAWYMLILILIDALGLTLTPMPFIAFFVTIAPDRIGLALLVPPRSPQM